jgi:DNA (cytosine-5)-methyltransferase 1
MVRISLGVSRPLAIDLFSGCGGLTLGLRRAGFRVAGAIELDPLAVETYKANHKRTVVWPQDIRKVSARRVMRELKLRRGQLDLLAGCPPCEGFSSLRTLNGGQRVRDPRNNLIFEFLRFVRVVRPRTVMMENVPALRNNKRFVLLCRALRRMGYSYGFRVLNAADYGVPQRRRRLILLASRFGPIPFASPALRRRTVRGAIGRLPHPRKSRDVLHNIKEARTERIRDLIRRIPKNGGSRKDLGAKSQLSCHQKCDGFKDIYGRLAWNDVASTITSGCFNPSKGRFLHPSQNRTLTLREAALLQSFPKTYFFSLKRGKSSAAALIGNALPPEFVRRHAQIVFQSLRKYRPQTHAQHPRFVTRKSNTQASGRR